MYNRQLQEGFREAKAITKKFAKTFYLASLFLPPDKKNASYAIYALCRLSDETVDDLHNLSPRKSLQQLQQKISLAYTKEEINVPLLAAFRHTVNTYRIPKEYFDRLIEGMYMDLEQKRYADFDALYEYCYRAAGIVGLIMLKVFGSGDKSAPDYAVKLGIAMQLTNILRDIKEDFGRDRVYLPQDELAKYKISEKQLALGCNNEEFKNLLRFQIKRAHQFYAESLPGIKLVDHQASRLVILAMAENYRKILKQIQKNDFNVFTRRAQVSKLKKLLTLLKILLEGKYR
jgi:15-cis-phytoene synthase